jgi:predicted ATPase/class 3 adenylate cyclase
MLISARMQVDGSVLPSGTVTFLFSDIVGSTAHWEADQLAMEGALAEHNHILEAVFAEHGGHIFKTVGDAYCVAFASATPAACAALDIHRNLQKATKPLQVRIGIHSGDIHPTSSDYFGRPVNKVARIQSAAQAGQTLVSDGARNLIVSPAILKDLGVHTLKDLLEPTRLWQLGEGEFVGPWTVDAVPNSLPLQTTSLVGRDEVLGQVGELMSKSRLITLTGTGGTGKTRLAIQLGAENLEKFPQGVWFCELAHLQDSDDALREIHQTVGGSQRHESLLQSLIMAIGDGACLLIMDNCEHLIDACSAIAEKLISRCRSLTILATSREPLAARGEVIFRVPSLPTPNDVDGPEDLNRAGATALFVERLSAVAPDLQFSREEAQAISRICDRLDGIPLAIELAAARGRSMPLREIEKRLDDRFRLLTGGSRNALSRQQTLRALIDWSVRLLNDQQKTLLFSLAIFVNGWDLETVEHVCSQAELGIESWEILDLLSALVDKSLVAYDPRHARYHLLESMRQYCQEAFEHLDCSLAIRDASAHYFLAVAEDFSDSRPDSRRDRSARFDENYDNIRAAIYWLLAQPDKRARLIEVVHDAIEGFVAVARMDDFMKIVEPLVEGGPTGISELVFERARVSYCLALNVNRDPRAPRILEEELHRYPSLSDDAKALWGWTLAYGLFYQSEFERCIAFCEQMAVDAEGVRIYYHNYANALFCIGRYEEAADYFLRAAQRGFDANKPWIAAASGAASVNSLYFGEISRGDSIAILPDSGNWERLRRSGIRPCSFSEVRGAKGGKVVSRPLPTF